MSSELPWNFGIVACKGAEVGVACCAGGAKRSTKLIDYGSGLSCSVCASMSCAARAM